MALVDLRGREDEPAVRALAGDARGGVLIGWEDRGALVACVCVERLDADEVALRRVAVAPEHRGRGVARALLDALAGVATARRLVADAGGDAAFLGRCGFAESGARWVRALEAVPAAAPAVTLAGLEQTIRDSWGRDTSDDPAEWSAENPARGQCAATAFVVRDLLGGEILLANVLRDGRRVERHAWNRLPSGLSLDLTRSQFAAGVEFDEPVPGEPVATDPSRHELLAQRVSVRLAP